MKCPREMPPYAAFDMGLHCFLNAVKPVLSGYSKIDKNKGLKDIINSRLMKVQSIAECSKKAFCNTFDLQQAIIGLENQF